MTFVFVVISLITAYEKPFSWWISLRVFELVKRKRLILHLHLLVLLCVGILVHYVCFQNIAEHLSLLKVLVWVIRVLQIISILSEMSCFKFFRSRVLKSNILCFHKVRAFLRSKLVLVKVKFLTCDLFSVVYFFVHIEHWRNELVLLTVVYRGGA